MVRSFSLSLVLVGAMIGASCHAQEAATADAPTLTIGSEAPSLDIEHWLSNGHGKFEPVTKFEPGKVYVVEFWATWCGPCIASMPHLVGLQQRYGDQGVMIVSVSDEPLETVESFLKGEVQGNEAIETAREVLASAPSSETDDDEDEDEDEEDEDEDEDDEDEDDDEDDEDEDDEDDEDEDDDEDDSRLPTYGDLTSAYSLATDPDESVKLDFFRAAGQRGIPCAFIVGKSGQVEWIGHPMAMDDPLAQVVGDSWDREAFAEEFRARQEFERLVNAAVAAGRTGKYDELDAVLAELRALDASPELVGQANQMAERLQGMALMAMFVNDPDRALEVLPARVKELAGDTEQINALTWQLVQLSDRGQRIKPELLRLAAGLTEDALDTNAPQSSLLDTIAHLHYHAGDLEKAIEYQRRAVEQLTAGDQKAAIEGYLEQLLEEQKAAAEAAESEPDDPQESGDE